MKTILLIFGLLISTAVSAQVSPLLSTTWNQTCYYNALTPAVGSGGSCGNSFTGCNATAMAQICKYYAYPTTGFGSHCNSNFPTECADYSLANYNYAAMSNNVTSSNGEVAQLMYDLGVSVDMNWNGSNSTSFFDSKVLKKYFAYSPRLYPTATFLFGSTAELIAGLKHELDEGRPVYAKGGGHFYLIDGYNASNEFHMNFGWSGTYDGYYPINSVVTPAGSFTPSNFMFYIMPMTDDLETAKDTLFVGAGGNASIEVEFTSLSAWTMSTTDSWLSLPMTSGGAGYFDTNEGSTVAVPVNNGPSRIGYIVISNATETDTLVVVQDPSPMVVTPSLILFPEGGGTESVSIDYYSWGTWSASTAESWLTLPINSGTGPSTIDLVCEPNFGAARTGQVIINGGTFVDTVFVSQDESTAELTDLKERTLEVFPNPVETTCVIQNLPIGEELVMTDVDGSVILHQQITHSSMEIDFKGLSRGVYLVQVHGRSVRLIKH